MYEHTFSDCDTGTTIGDGGDQFMSGTGDGEEDAISVAGATSGDGVPDELYATSGCGFAASGDVATAGSKGSTSSDIATTGDGVSGDEQYGTSGVGLASCDCSVSVDAET